MAVYVLPRTIRHHLTWNKASMTFFLEVLELVVSTELPKESSSFKDVFLELVFDFAFPAASGSNEAYSEAAVEYVVMTI